MFFCCIGLHAVNYVSNGTGSWSTTTIWTPNGTPTSVDNVTISTGHTITMNAATGNCANLTINGTLTFSAANTLNVAGNMRMNAGSSFTGSATGIVNVTGTFMAASGGTSTIGRGTLAVTSTSAINGTLAISNSNGTKTFTGNVTFANGSALSYSASETLDLTNNVTFNGAVTISGTTTGLMNVGGICTVSSGASVSLSDLSLAVTGNTQIDGTIAYGNNLGTKTFSSIVVSATGNWNCSAADESFIITSSLSVNGSFSASLTTTGNTEYQFNGASCTFSGTATIPHIYVIGAASSLTNNGILTCTDSIYGGGTFSQGAGSTFNWNSSHKIKVGTFDASASNNLVEYLYTGFQYVVGATYYNLKLSSSGSKQLSGNIVVQNVVTIANTAALDASSSGYGITVGGNWTVTSTNADPFVEQTGTVTFNGTSTQSISTVLAAGESFYDLVINNTAAASPSVSVNKNISVNDSYTHTAGKLDLAGKTLSITGSSTASVDNFTGGSITSSSSGASIVITDPNINKRVNFYGTAIGTSTQGITMNVTSGDSYFTNTRIYGAATFTKSGSGNNDTQGGNVFYGPVTFQTTATADRWRMANAQPDTFYNATFIHDGINNFIVSRQTLGNAYYGTTTFTSTTTGGMYISRGNTTANGSSFFYGPVVVNVTLTGNVIFAEGSSTVNDAVTFYSTITLNSSSTSTGDIIFGASNSNNSTTLASGAQFLSGSITGATNIYIRNLTQLGTSVQTINTSGSTGFLYVGGSTSAGASYPNVFNGPCTFSADTAGYIINATFNNTAAISITNGNGYLISNTFANTTTATAGNLRFQNNTFNGAVTLTHSGASASTSNGGNIFNNSATVRTTGNGNLRCASFASDDYNSSALFIQTGSGVLQPVYSNDVTFAGNISTVGSTAVITFSSSTGTADPITDGSGTQTIDGPSSFIPVFGRLRTNHTGTVRLNKDITVSGTLTMTQGLVDLNSRTLTLGTGTTGATVGTLSYTNGWAYGGTFTRWQTTGTTTIGTVNGLIPVGSSTLYHPFWFAHSSALTTGGTISILHNPTAIGYTPASFNDASWGNNVQGISISAWTLITSNGLVVNGSTGQIRFGGYGYSPSVLTDLDACLVSSAIATHSAATSVTVPIEANRIGLTTAQLNNTWYIGTRNTWQSTLPVELLYFDAAVENGNVTTSWETVMEQNSDYFTVERSSNGVSFTEAGIIQGAGNSSQSIIYSYTDNNPLRGLSYYRLKQTDINGAFTYSAVRSVNFAGTLHVFPNPVCTGQPCFIGNGTSGQVMDIKIYDDTGRLVRSFSQTSGNIDASLLPGKYILEVTGAVTGRKTLVVQ